MIGAEMRATGNMDGTMNRSVWSEGSVMTSGKAAEAVLGRSMREVSALSADFTLNLTVDGAASSIQLNSNTTFEELATFLRNAGVRDNVAGMIGNAIRSHALSGGVETDTPLQVQIDT